LVLSAADKVFFILMLVNREFGIPNNYWLKIFTVYGIDEIFGRWVARGNFWG
jgi:hypothetical protein